MTTPPAGGRHRASAAPVAAERTRDGSRLRLLTRVLAALCLPAAAAIVVFLVRTPSVGADTGTLTGPTSHAATAAAHTEVAQILSYDYRTLSANLKTAEADTTGVFAKQYATTASQLLKEAKQEKAIVKATVGTSGVVSASSSNVVILLFVDQASVRQPKGQKSTTTRIDQSRVRVTMTRVGGKWLVSQLQAL